MSKRILLISDAASFWTKRYIENLLLPEGWEVVLFPIWDQTGRFDDYYREHGVTVYRDTHTLPFIRRIPRVRMWARIHANARSLRALGPFDAIHNHYLSQRDLALGDRLRRAFPNAKWLCSFWGSDLMRSTGVELRRMKRYLERCDHVTVHSALHVDKVRRVFGETIADKTALVYFGQTVLDDIARVRADNDHAACKAHFNLPTDKAVIALGYNASPTHQHMELLRALKKLPEETLRGWSLILQMTYGSQNDSYADTVRALAETLPCKTLILTEFLNDSESAYLRLAADAFVLAIPTDAFSGSLQEYLFAGTHVLCADWLRYPQLDELGIKPTIFHDISQVPDLLREALATPIPEAELASRAQLRERYSWASCREAWLRLYD